MICHIPFTMRHPEVFDIETDIYEEWTALLRNFIRPELILCGHMHRTAVIECGSEGDAYGQPCPVLIGSGVEKHSDGTVGFTGAGLTLTDGSISAYFTDNGGNIEKVL